MSSKVVKVKSWEEFKQLIIEHDPSGIAYNIEQGIPASNLTGLRLILPVRGIQYVFIDTVAGDRLRKTGLPTHRDKRGNIYIKDEDVTEFLRFQINKNLKLYSYWTI